MCIMPFCLVAAVLGTIVGKALLKHFTCPTPLDPYMHINRGKYHHPQLMCKETGTEKCNNLHKDTLRLASKVN